MAEAGDTVNHCSHCGAALDGAVNYCPQCGTRHRETTPARDASTADTGTGTTSATNTGVGDTSTASATTEDTTDEKLLAFRRRVQDRMEEGWDLKHDYGNRVVLADRGLGTPWVHAVLLVFTGGVGNIIYGWYSHSYNADQKVMRAEGTSRGQFDADRHEVATDDSKGGLGSYILGAVLLVMGIAVIAGSPLDLVAVVMGLLFLAGAVWSLPPTKRRLKDRHPVTTFGPTRSTETATVRDPATPCVMCASPITEGVERRYREEYVVAGVPLFRTESGKNHYCKDCAIGGVEDVGVAPTTLATDSIDDDPDGDHDSDRAVETDPLDEFEP